VRRHLQLFVGIRIERKPHLAISPNRLWQICEQLGRDQKENI
jgi:hypothetical protein